ncbi:MAG: hypothetical protein ACLUNT_05280 [Eubacterium ventriosum]
MRRKLICILAGLTVAVELVGCGQKKAVEETTVATSETGSESSTVLNGTASKSSTGSDGADTTLTITVGGSQVMLDEVRYYAYTAQATYETYYLTKGKEIDWDSKMDGDVTWEQGVKSLVLDDICKREWLNEISSQYDIKLTKKEKLSVKTKALEYFKNTNVKLAKKINISEGRLIKVFEKAEIADKTEKKMEKDGSSTKEMYIKWKKGNNVTAESQWNNINFKEAIFTLEDVK